MIFLRSGGGGALQENIYPLNLNLTKNVLVDPDSRSRPDQLHCEGDQEIKPSSIHGTAHRREYYLEIFS